MKATEVYQLKLPVPADSKYQPFVRAAIVTPFNYKQLSEELKISLVKQFDVNAFHAPWGTVFAGEYLASGTQTSFSPDLFKELYEPYGTEEKTPRLTRTEMFMKIAEVVAQRGTCDRARVGAVLVDPENWNIMSIGYNGAPSGEKHCDEVGHLMFGGHCIRTIHAEKNCFHKVEIPHGKKLHLYVTHKPCTSCLSFLAETMHSTGSHLTVIYLHDYGETSVIQALVHEYVTLGKVTYGV